MNRRLRCSQSGGSRGFRAQAGALGYCGARLVPLRHMKGAIRAATGLR